MARKQPKRCDFNASIGNNDNFGMMYVGMCQSKQYQALSRPAQVLYVFCRVQAQSTQGRQCLYKRSKEAGIEYNSDTHFVFPATHLERYGYTRQAGSKYLQELTSAGFICIVEQNQFNHNPNVYRFSSDWKN